MVRIFAWGAGIEEEMRIAFLNIPLSHYLLPFIPISENELTTILATGVQNGFCSKQTASERFPYATPAEWYRCQQEKRDQQEQELLLQEQKLEIQNDATVEMQEELAEIQNDGEQTTTTATNATAATVSSTESTDRPARKVRIRKGSGSQGKKRGRPSLSGAQWDANRNEINPVTGRAYSKWDEYNATH